MLFTLGEINLTLVRRSRPRFEREAESELVSDVETPPVSFFFYSSSTHTDSVLGGVAKSSVSLRRSIVTRLCMFVLSERSMIRDSQYVNQVTRHKDVDLC